MLLHLVSEGGHDHGCGLAPTAVIPEDLHDAVLKAGVLEHVLFKVSRTDRLRQDVRLEFLGLIVVLQGIAVLVGPVKELLDLLLEFDWLVVHGHEHDLLLESVITSRWGLFRLSFFLLVKFIRENALDLLDLVDRDTLSWVNNPNER